MNYVCLCGRIGSDIELKKTQSGVSVIKFPLAVDRRYQQDGERITDWIDIEAWRSTAEFIEKWFAKGDPIILCGEIRTSVWTDNEGGKHKRAYMMANVAEFVPQKKQDADALSANADGQRATFAPKAGTLPPTSENAIQSRTAAFPTNPTEEREQVQLEEEDLPF